MEPGARQDRRTAETCERLKRDGRMPTHELFGKLAKLERELGTPAERLRADQPEW